MKAGRRLVEVAEVGPTRGALFYRYTCRPEVGLRDLDVREPQAISSLPFDEQVRPAREAVLGRPLAREVQVLDVVRATGALPTTAA